MIKQFELHLQNGNCIENVKGREHIGIAIVSDKLVAISGSHVLFVSPIELSQRDPN